MNRKDLADQVSDYIRTEIGDNDTDDVELGEVATEVEAFIEDLEEDDDVDEDEEVTEASEK